MPTPLIRPPRLQPGDGVGIAAPAWPYGDYDAIRVQRALGMLETLHFRPILAPHALATSSAGSIAPELRAADLNLLFRNPDVAAIICLCGGGNAHAVLPHLDWATMQATPKIVLGYSAITALLLGITSRTNIVTFHGPMILDGFSEYPALLPFTRTQLECVLMRGEAPFAFTPPDAWTSAPPDDDAPRPMVPQAGWRWLRGGQATGPLLGGNLTALRALAGTRYWPNFQGAILCIEDVNYGRGFVLALEESLAHLQLVGVFDQIAGLVIGRINDLSPSDADLVDALVLDACLNRAVPIVSHVDFGHTDPRLILPLGVPASLDGDQHRFHVLDAGVGAPRQHHDGG